MTSEETLPFLVSIVDEDEDGGSMAIFGRRRDEPVLRHVPVSAVRANVTRLVDQLRGVFRDIAATADEITLEQVEVSFEVSATGKVALLGTSTEATGKGAITLTFGRGKLDE